LEAHVRLTVGRAQRVLDGCGFMFPRDIGLTPVQEYLQRLTADRPVVEPEPDRAWFTRDELATLLGVGPDTIRTLMRRHRLSASGQGKARRYPRATVLALLKLAGRGMGTCTARYYAREVKAFTRWLVKRKRLAEDPLADLPGASGDDSDHRRDRRALEPEELRQLLAAADTSVRVFRKLTGPDRHHLYLTAMGTGFRASELAALCPEHFDLAGDPPAVHLPAEAAKNGKAAVQPITQELAGALTDYLAGRRANQSGPAPGTNGPRT
jgi:excisionase family DNA binding protein